MLRHGCTFDGICTHEQGEDASMQKNYKHAVLVHNVRDFVWQQYKLAATFQPTIISAASLALPMT